MRRAGCITSFAERRRTKSICPPIRLPLRPRVEIERATSRGLSTCPAGSGTMRSVASHGCERVARRAADARSAPLDGDPSPRGGLPERSPRRLNDRGTIVDTSGHSGRLALSARGRREMRALRPHTPPHTNRLRPRCAVVCVLSPRLHKRPAFAGLCVLWPLTRGELGNKGGTIFSCRPLLGTRISLRYDDASRAARAEATR
jgi:hypothetical protein